MLPPEAVLPRGEDKVEEEEEDGGCVPPEGGGALLTGGMDVANALGETLAAAAADV